MPVGIGLLAYVDGCHDERRVVADVDQRTTGLVCPIMEGGRLL
ncbi:MAG: hypothetical protein ACRDQ4_03110 [Pseudonocardiaceae bacterium]